MNDRIAQLAVHAARLLLGLIFFVFGLNGFLGFLPHPPAPPEAAAFGGALAATGYMLPLIKGTEVVTGLLLLSNRFVPLALVVLAPVVVNIVAFHAVLAPGSIAITLVVLALELALAYAYRASFRSVLALDAKPTTRAAERSSRELAAA
jgi:uncharacterized membrane protein YphA (DoxX/SURF4 family)